MVGGGVEGVGEGGSNGVGTVDDVQGGGKASVSLRE